MLLIIFLVLQASFSLTAMECAVAKPQAVEQPSPRQHTVRVLNNTNDKLAITYQQRGDPQSYTIAISPQQHYDIENYWDLILLTVSPYGKLKRFLSSKSLCIPPTDRTSYLRYYGSAFQSDIRWVINAPADSRLTSGSWEYATTLLTELFWFYKHTVEQEYAIGCETYYSYGEVFKQVQHVLTENNKNPDKPKKPIKLRYFLICLKGLRQKIEKKRKIFLLLPGSRDPKKALMIKNFLLIRLLLLLKTLLITLQLLLVRKVIIRKFKHI